MENFSDFSFDIESSETTSRNAFRVIFSGMYVHVNGLAKVFSVVDISAIGFSFSAKSTKFDVSGRIVIDIIIAKKIVIKGLQAEIIRLLQDNVVACAFREVSRHQEYDLDKLVLEIQKRNISSLKFSK